MQEKKVKKVDKRTISSETHKIFLIVFLVLSSLGVFTVGATWKGKSVFNVIQSTQLPLFNKTNELHASTLEIIGIYYLLSGENDIELQMAQMLRYDDLAKKFAEQVDGIKAESKSITDIAVADAVQKSSTEIKAKFEELNAAAREMMLARYSGDKEKVAKEYKILLGGIETFKASVKKLQETVDEDLKRGTKSALSILSGSNLFGIFMTLASIFVAMALIRYLMKFLSVSLLPISNLMHNLRQSVFSVDEKGQVISPVSKYSEKIFSGDIVGESLDHLLLEHLGSKSEAYASAKTALVSVFGEDDMQWSLMEDNLPPLVRRSVAGQEKYIKLSYTPLYNEKQVVQNVMVVAEDVTELEKVKAESHKQQVEVRILQGLIGVDRGDLEAFFNDAIAGVKQCNELVESMTKDFEVRKQIFRTLHTMKGNSRLYNLMALSEVIHAAETAVVEINRRLDAAESVPPELYQAYLAGLRDTEDVLAAHTKVACTMFGLADAMATSRFWQMEELMWFLEAGSADPRTPLFNQEDQAAGTVVFQHAFMRIDARWENNVASVQKLGQYFGCQEIADAAGRVLLQVRTPGASIVDSFRELKNAVFRFTVQSSWNRNYDVNFDDVVLLIANLCSTKRLTGRRTLKQLSEGERSELLSGIYEAYQSCDTHGMHAQRYYLQALMLGIAKSDERSFESVQAEAWKLLSSLVYIDASFNLNEGDALQIAEAIPNPSQPPNLQLIPDEVLSGSLIGEIIQCQEIGGLPSVMVLNTMAAALKIEGLSGKIKGLLGTSAASARLREFVEIIKGGLSTAEAMAAAEKFVANAELTLERELFAGCISSIGNRLHLIRTVDGYNTNGASQEEAAASKSMEVTTQWFNQVSELVDKMEFAPKGSLDSIREELQELIAGVFDYPLSSLCKKMEPMVRDLSIKLGKNINYVVTGDLVALPREQAYAFRDALVHMLRNSLDHGIEMPSDRASLGKVEFATIEINCRQKDGDIVEISVIDDGAGINIEKVKAKAVALNAISPETAASMSEKDALQLIFISRLSTKEEVSSLSGRGVGMDAVKSIIVDRMKGSIDVSSSKNFGTSFKLVTKREKRRTGSQTALDEVSSFLLGAAKDVAECLDIMDKIPFDKNIAAAAFRNLHTIKGNATLLSLRTISEKAHAAESILSDMLSDTSAANRQALEKLSRDVTLLHEDLVNLLSQRVGARSEAGDEKVGFMTASARQIGEWIPQVPKIASDAFLQDKILRGLHTMKGNATLYGERALADKLHRIETALIANDVIGRLATSANGAQSDNNPIVTVHALMKEVHSSLLATLSGSSKKGAREQSSDPTLVFIEKAADSINLMLEQIYKISSSESDAAKAFRELHTLKGMASMNNLGAVVDRVHAAETTLDLICKCFVTGKRPSPEQAQEFRGGLMLVVNVLNRERQNRSKRKPQGSDPAGVFLESASATVKSLIDQLGRISTSEAGASAAFRELHTLKGMASMNSLSAVAESLHVAEAALEEICKSFDARQTPSREKIDIFQTRISAVSGVLAEEVQKTGKTRNSKKARSATAAMDSATGNETENFLNDLEGFLNEVLLADKNQFVDQAFLQQLFRRLHTAKSNAEMQGLSELVTLIHSTEDRVTEATMQVTKGDADERTMKLLGQSLGELKEKCDAARERSGRRLRKAG